MDVRAAYGTAHRLVARLTRPWLVGSLLFLCVLSGYLLSYNVDKPTHNADWYLRYTVTCAIVESNTFAIHPYREDGRSGVGVGGKMYTQYTLGQSAAMVPLYLLGRRLAGLAHTDCAAKSAPMIVLLTCKLLDPILGALLAVLFYATARLLAYPRRVALTLAALLAFGAPLWPDVLSGEEHTMESLFLLAAAYAALRFTQATGDRRLSKVGQGYAGRKPALQVGTRDLWLVAMGLAAGLVFVTRVAGVIVLPIFAVYLLLLHRRLQPGPGAWRRPFARDLALYTLGALPGILVNAVYDAVRFGSPLLTNPPAKPDHTLGYPPWLGLPNLLVSPGKGLLWYAPALLLLALAVPPFRRRFPLPALLCALICGVYLLFYSNVNYWHGDPAWGPRYLYATLPYLILPLGEVFARWRGYRRPVRGLLVGALALSFLVQFSAVSVSYWRHWHYIYGYHYDQVENHNWGQNLNYWWSPEQSPILISLEGIADITQKYVDGAPLAQHPAADRLSNPDESCGFHIYGREANICLTDLDDLRFDANWNTFTLWWVHVYPWWSQRTVIALAVALVGLLVASGGALVLLLSLAEAPGWGGARAPAEAYDGTARGDGGNGRKNGNGNGRGHGYEHSAAFALDLAALPRLDVAGVAGAAGEVAYAGTPAPGGVAVQAPPTPRVVAPPRAVAARGGTGLAPLGLAAVIAATAYGGIVNAAALTAPRQAPPLIRRVARDTTVRDGNWTYRVLGVSALPALPGGIDEPAFGHHYVAVQLRLFNLLTRPHHVRLENFALTDDAGLSYPNMYIINSDFRAQAGELYHLTPLGMQVPARSSVDNALIFLVRNGARCLKLLGPGIALVDLGQ